MGAVTPAGDQHAARRATTSPASSPAPARTGWSRGPGRRTSRSSCATARARSRAASSATPTSTPGASTAATSCGSRAGSSASATSCRSTCARSSRAPAGEADPAAFLPVAYRDLDELDGFLEHLAGEVRDAPFKRLRRRRCSADARAARRAAARAVHARRPPRLPRRPARAHGRRRDARGRDLRAAPAPRPGPPAHRGDRPRPRPDARVHARRRDRPDRRGPAARPRRDRAADARRARAATRGLDDARRLALAHCVLHAPRRRRGAATALRLGRGARAAPPQRARRGHQGRVRDGVRLVTSGWKGRLAAPPGTDGAPTAKPLVPKECLQAFRAVEDTARR